jgi:2-polyprenyl-3-methyl-5-hydroxy-6-metoxy-1,4-benzoquinol methylase
VPSTHEDADVETSSDAYAGRFAGAVGAYFLEVQAEATLDLLRPWPGARVLDVGGGHGQVTGPLVDAGYQVTVLGSAPRCESRVKRWTRDGKAGFAAGDLLSPPFPERSFDVVLSYRLLPHVRRWPELVAGLARLARVAVVVDYPTTRSVNALSRWTFGLKKGVEGDTRPFRVFRDHEIEEAFAEQGLAPTGRQPQFLFPMALHRATGSATLARAIEGAGGALGLRRAFGSPVILRTEPASGRRPWPGTPAARHHRVPGGLERHG